MANLKFSDFTADAAIVQDDHFLVGFDDDGGGSNPKNNKWTFAQVAAGLAAVTATPYNMYFGDGTVTADATRTITMAGTANIIFTGGTGNSIQIGNLSAADGIGWKITPGTGGASASMTIADTNGQNIIFKYANGNNPGIAKPRIIGIGEQMASATYDGKGAAAVNWPNNYNANLPWLTSSTSDTSGLWVWAGGHRNTATLIGKYGNNNAGNDTDRIFQCIGWPGTAANPNTQRIFTITTDGTVAIGDASNSSTYKAATNLKVNGQAYSVFHQPSIAITDLTIDWNNSNIQEVTLAASSPTFTASNPKAGATYILTIKQTGAVTPTWTGVKWPANTAPVLSGNEKTDVITLICYSESANSGAGAYYGSSVLNFTT